MAGEAGGVREQEAAAAVRDAGAESFSEDGLLSCDLMAVILRQLPLTCDKIGEALCGSEEHEQGSCGDERESCGAAL